MYIVHHKYYYSTFITLDRLQTIVHTHIRPEIKYEEYSRNRPDSQRSRVPVVQLSFETHM